MRLYIGVPLFEAFSEEILKLERFFKPIYPDLRWTNWKNLHITLHFFGEVDPERLQEIRAVLTACEAWSAISITLEGFGCFPDFENPYVIWLGVSQKTQEALALRQRELTSKLEVINFKICQRDYKAHATIGRVPRGKEFTWKNPTPKFKTTEKFVPKITLYQSHLNPTGSTHLPIAQFSLSQAKD
ncbi:MAG: 2'-5' RNA ligase [Candidatus Omnitrophota bacterium]|jgi:2'-5' RNA ligase